MTAPGEREVVSPPAPRSGIPNHGEATGDKITGAEVGKTEMVQNGHSYWIPSQIRRARNFAARELSQTTSWLAAAGLTLLVLDLDLAFSGSTPIPILYGLPVWYVASHWP